MEEIRQEEYTVVVDESKASSLKRLTPERFLLGLLAFYQVITDQDYPDIKLILKIVFHQNLRSINLFCLRVSKRYLIA